MTPGVFVINCSIEGVGDRDLTTSVEAVEYCTMDDASEPYQLFRPDCVPDFPTNTVEQLTRTEDRYCSIPIVVDRCEMSEL